ncbi:MAG: CcoQ/FixQ family Cbb3-type cytochrome c oxidase assembly chaperone [Proteobacteria bacterium]|nr:CcoQ/FixQ family Cbb3-type cytochrome c oxidase assembly chaperone [Pseudomonadota bacterium]
MNPIFRHAAENSDAGPMMGVLTLMFMACFAYWTWWAYAPSHAQAHDAASRLPLDEEA